MSLYYCNHCDKLLNKDYILPHPDPTDAGLWICEDCLTEYLHEQETEDVDAERHD